MSIFFSDIKNTHKVYVHPISTLPKLELKTKCKSEGFLYWLICCAAQVEAALHQTHRTTECLQLCWFISLSS